MFKTINKKVWLQYDEGQINNFVEEIFQHYRLNGYPFYSVDKDWRDKEFKKLKSYDYLRVIKDNMFTQSMHGLSLAWSYFPHHIKVQCRNFRTPYDVFNDDELFKKAIHKRLKIGDYVSDSGIRKILKIYTGTQSVSNFRPTAAAAIYHTFNAKTTWDMSCGYGGRLLGSIIANVHYIGTDPCLKTHQGLMQISKDYGNAEIYQCGSEDFIPDKESLDLCFSSPPYFDIEKYSDESTQSYIKYPNLNDWYDNFLGQTIRNCYIGLKSTGNLVININDEKKTIEVAEKNGFKHIKTMKYALSNLTGKDYKYEPLIVFKKN